MSSARTWGTDAPERARTFPCDAHLPNASAAYFRGISVRARPDVLSRRVGRPAAIRRARHP